MTLIITTIILAQRKLATEHMPHKVVVPSLIDMARVGTDREMTQWCHDQIGPMAWSLPTLSKLGIITPYITRVTFNTDHLWCKVSTSVFRFKNEDHAAGFKLVFG